jgi:hypothetical protein
VIDAIVNVGCKYATNPALKNFLFTYSERKIELECEKAFLFGQSYPPRKNANTAGLGVFSKFASYLSFRRIRDCAKILLLLRNAKLVELGSLPDDIARYIFFVMQFSSSLSLSLLFLFFLP